MAGVDAKLADGAGVHVLRHVENLPAELHGVPLGGVVELVTSMDRRQDVPAVLDIIECRHLRPTQRDLDLPAAARSSMSGAVQCPSNRAVPHLPRQWIHEPVPVHVPAGMQHSVSAASTHANLALAERLRSHVVQMLPMTVGKRKHAMKRQANLFGSVFACAFSRCAWMEYSFLFFCFFPPVPAPSSKSCWSAVLLSKAWDRRESSSISARCHVSCARSCAILKSFRSHSTVCYFCPCCRHPLPQRLPRLPRLRGCCGRLLRLLPWRYRGARSYNWSVLMQQ